MSCNVRSTEAFRLAILLSILWHLLILCGLLYLAKHPSKVGAAQKRNLPISVTFISQKRVKQAKVLPVNPQQPQKPKPVSTKPQKVAAASKVSHKVNFYIKPAMLSGSVQATSGSAGMGAAQTTLAQSASVTLPTDQTAALDQPDVSKLPAESGSGQVAGKPSYGTGVGSIGAGASGDSNSAGVGTGTVGSSGSGNVGTAEGSGSAVTVTDYYAPGGSGLPYDLPSKSHTNEPKRVVYLIDCSPSMKYKLRAATAEIRSTISDLVDGDKYDIIFFSDDAYTIAPNLLPHTSTTMADVNSYLSVEAKRKGGTNLEKALLLALTIKESRDIIVLTDGLPNTGLCGIHGLTDKISRANTELVSIYTVDLVDKINDSQDERDKAVELLTLLAKKNNGAFIAKDAY